MVLSGYFPTDTKSPVKDSAAAGGKVKPALNSRIARDRVDPAELMFVIVDVDPGLTVVIRTEERWRCSTSPNRHNDGYFFPGAALPDPSDCARLTGFNFVKPAPALVEW